MSVKPPLSCVPPVWVMATTEEMPLAFDTTNVLENAQVPYGPTCVLTDVSVGRGLIVDLPTDPTVSGNIVTQQVDGSALTAGHIYTLAVTFSAAADTVWTMLLTIRVPQ